MRRSLFIFFILILFSFNSVYSQHLYNNTDCNSFSHRSKEYQNCKLQWFCSSPDLLNIPIDSVYMFYNLYTGKASAFLSEDKIPWISNYFLFVHGGIATRWQSVHFKPGIKKINPQTFPIQEQLSWDNIAAMDAGALDTLSPAEKLDIYLGYTDFRITKWELNHRGPLRNDVKEWEGFCNGVRMAGQIFREPDHAITVTSKADSTISIRFFPADLKAIAIASCYNAAKYIQLGNAHSNTNNPDPVAFDVTLRLLVGENYQPVFFDRFSEIDRIKRNKDENEIWNSSIIGYERWIESVTDIDTSTKAALIKVKLYTLEDVDDKILFNTSTIPFVLKKDSAFVKHKIYKYELVIQSSGEIISGRWLDNYPDLVWLVTGAGTQYVYDSKLKKPILKGDPWIHFSEVQNLLNSPF